MPLGYLAAAMIGGKLLGGRGGGGGGGQPTQTTSYQTNIPEYAQPYVETMLGTAQQQIYNYDANGRPTGMKPYQPFSEDPNAYFAGLSPMQQQAFQGAANLSTAPQLAGATGIAAEAGLRGLDTRYGTGQFEAPSFASNYAQQYMNPYMQGVVDVQQREAQRQADIAGTQRGAQAVQSGAFGGSRQAVMDAEAARNLAQQKGDIQASGLNAAYQQAQQQFNADMARRMQAQQLTEQSRQYGAGLGMQGLQTALQSAGQLGQLGQTQYGQQVGNINLLNQMGGQQQQLEQAKINQQIQNYATAQQYPMMQLANMNNLLRGLPMQSTTVQGYQASPNPFTQLGGLGLTAAGFMGKAGKKGGQPKNFEKTKQPAGLAELALMKMA